MLQSTITFNNSNMNFSYLYSTKDRDMLEKYFKLKNKYDYKFIDNEYEELKEQIIENFDYYDLVIYPETSGKYLLDIAQVLGENVLCVQKNSKDQIIKELLKQPMMKAEKQSLLSTIDEMEEAFQINKIKGNQRKRFNNILFEKIDLKDFKDKKILLLDDSVFSGHTLLALKESLNIDCDVNVIFSKF